jgi:hypothetical protein
VPDIVSQRGKVRNGCHRVIRSGFVQDYGATSQRDKLLRRELVSTLPAEARRRVRGTREVRSSTEKLTVDSESVRERGVVC